MFFRVALVQIKAEPLNPLQNLQVGLEACRKAHRKGADLALFPEMFSTGYIFFDGKDPDLVKKWKSMAMETNDFWLKEFRDAARQLQMAVCITYLGKGKSRPRNSMVIYDRYGNECLQYDKVHTCCFADLEGQLEPGEEFKTASLDTDETTVKIGAMICFDREFPESARTLMLKGAEVILTPNACELETHRVEQFRTRAFENMVGMAMTNYPRPLNNGNSLAVSPMAFGPDETSMNMVIAECGEHEEVRIAEFNLESIRRYREREVWGHRYRRPEAYL